MSNEKSSNKNSGFCKHPLAVGIISVLCLSVTELSLSEEASNDAASKIVLDEIIVTAQRRSENIQDVPMSITAFSADNLKNTGARRFEDIADFIPNVNFVSNDSIRATQITVRGIVSDANSIGVEQAAGVYVDGVYMGRPTTINTGAYDIERVEVLRGPQGTLYGKNVIAGAINFITRKPDNELAGELSLNYGNYDNTIAYGNLNVPVIDDKLSLRISAQSEKRDGYLENLAGPDNNDADNINGRFSLLYNPNDNLEVILRADSAKDRTHTGANELAIVSPVFSQAPFNILPGDPLYVPDDAFDYKIADARSSFQDRDVLGSSLEVNWDVGGGVLTSISAYREFDFNNFQTSDKSPFDIFGTGILEDQEQYSQELRFSSGTGDRFEYVVGLYYFKMDLSAEPTAKLGEDALSVPAFGGLPLGSLVGGSISKLKPVIENESYAVFGQAHYEVTDKLTLTAGLRYTQEKKSIVFSVEPDGLIVNPIDPEVKSADLDEGVISPMFSIAYGVNEDIQTYFTYARGFKAGGYNAFDFDFSNDDGSVPEFDPEFVDSFELGAKTEWFDQRVRLNASIYYMDYQDLQVNQRLEDENGVFFFRTSNAGEAESMGMEIELVAQVLENLQINAAYGYAETEYKDFLVDEATNQDFTGNELTLSPKNTFSTTAQYNRPITNGWNMLVRGEYLYRSSTFSDQANTPRFENNSRSIVNARLGFENQDLGIRVTAWVRNLFEQEYTLVRGEGSGAFSPGSLQYSVGNPRTYGMEISYTF